MNNNMISQVRRRNISHDILQQYNTHPPDSMVMDEDRFAEYAEQLEKEDFEEDIMALSCSVRQLVDARFVLSKHQQKRLLLSILPYYTTILFEISLSYFSCYFNFVLTLLIL